MKPAKPLTRTHETPTRKMWGKGLTGTGTGWPGIPQGYPWYSLGRARPSCMASLATEPTFSHMGCLWLCPCPSSLWPTFSSSCYPSFTWPALWIEDWWLMEVVIFSVTSTQSPIFNVGKTIQETMTIPKHHLFNLT